MSISGQLSLSQTHKICRRCCTHDLKSHDCLLISSPPIPTEYGFNRDRSLVKAGGTTPLSTYSFVNQPILLQPPFDLCTPSAVSQSQTYSTIIIINKQTNMWATFACQSRGVSRSVSLNSGWRTSGEFRQTKGHLKKNLRRQGENFYNRLSL